MSLGIFPFASMWCTVRHLTGKLPRLHLILFDLWHEPCPLFQHLSGHVLIVNYSSVCMKGMPRKQRGCQTPLGIFQAENMIQFEVWTAVTVFCDDWWQHISFTDTNISGLKLLFAIILSQAILYSLNLTQFQIHTKLMRVKACISYYKHSIRAATNNRLID